MTDRQSLIAMFDRAGVVWTAGFENEQAVVLEAQTGPANLGYNGFVVAFGFAEDGSLTDVGVWE